MYLSNIRTTNTIILYLLFLEHFQTFVHQLSTTQKIVHKSSTISCLNTMHIFKYLYWSLWYRAEGDKHPIGHCAWFALEDIFTMYECWRPTLCGTAKKETVLSNCRKFSNKLLVYSFLYYNITLLWRLPDGIIRSNKYARIRDDSFRTFASDPKFLLIVPEVSIVRICNSFQHYHGTP